jgi:hypothetical protein
VEKGNAAGETNYGSVPGTFGLAVEAPAAESSPEQSTPVQGTSLPPPTITGLSPSQGPVAGGTVVALTGTNLTGATVKVGGKPAPLTTAATATQITFTTPAGTAGAKDAEVTTPAGTATLAKGFTYVAPVAPPTISGLSPNQGPVVGGTAVILTGTNLLGATGVTVGGTPATPITVVSDTEITFTTPRSATGVDGPADVAVTTPDSTVTMAKGFTYAPQATITKLVPNSGPLAGGITVTLTGTNLTGATKVTFSGTPATDIKVVSDSEITFTIPQHGPGAKTVEVTTPGGEMGEFGVFTYVAPPTITSLSQDQGSVNGGANISLIGTNLIGATSVTVGGRNATAFTVDSATQITFTTPAGAEGAANVAVTTWGGTATMTDGFTYVPTPTITGLSPSSGPLAGGTEVTLIGENLTGATGVTVGGTSATSITVVGDTQITFTTPSAPNGEPGAVDVVVTTPYGKATSAGGFTYIGPPTITKLDPNSGSANGGMSVYLEGTNLTGATSVTVGGVAAKPVIVWGATQISFTMPAGTAGAADVVVTTPGGSATSVFTYVAPSAPPTITSLTPNSGSTAGGTEVTLTGTNLIDVIEVTMGGIPAASTVNSDTQITFITSSWEDDVALPVKVSTKYGESNGLMFEYFYPRASALLTLAASPDETKETGAPDSSENQTPDGVGEDSGEGATPPPAEGGSTPSPDAGQPTDGQNAPGGSAEGTNDGSGETAVPPAADGQGSPPANGQGAPPANGQGAPPPNGQGTPPPNGQGAPPPNGQGAPPPEGQGTPPAASQPAGAVTRLTILLSTAWRSR